MTNSINANVIGTVVNVYLNGVLHSKDCGTIETANAMFKQILEAKTNPTQDAIDGVLGFLNKNIRIARKGGLVFEPETGNMFLEGFNTPIPDLMVETMENYIENDFPMEAITNFWTLLMANPDKRVRESLFKFIQTHDFSITDKGYMIVYKSVDIKQENEFDLPSFVSNRYLHVKLKWFTSPKKYIVYKDTETGELFITKKSTFVKWDLNEKGIEEVGNLSDLQSKLDELIDDKTTIFTDHHTKTMNIQLGVPVIKERVNCDSNPSRDCSNGLHVGATKYVTNFGGSNSPVLVCLVNPMNVVAVPDYDHSKMRVSEYFPYALASRDEDGTIDIIEQPFYEEDYTSIEMSALDKLLVAVRAEERLEVDVEEAEDNRELDELQKILETRVVELSN